MSPPHSRPYGRPAAHEATTGLNVSVALHAADEIDDPEARVVALFCDTGENGFL